MKRACGELGGGGGIPVDEDGDGIFAFAALAGGCFKELLRFASFPDGNDGCARRDEHAENFDCLVEIAAAVFAEVENEQFHALVLELIESCFDFTCAICAEGGEPDVANGRIGGEGGGFDERALLDIAMGELHLDFAGTLGVAEGQLELVAWPAAETFQDFREIRFAGLSSVDPQDCGAGHEPRLLRRAGSCHGGDEGFSGVLSDTHAEGADLVVEYSLLAHHFLHFRMDEGGVRIEAGKHPVERLVNKAVVGELVEIRVAGADCLKHLDEAFEGGVGGFLRIGWHRIGRRGRKQRSEQERWEFHRKRSTIE